MTLKRSSIIHHVYIGKNILEIVLVLVFLPIGKSSLLKSFSQLINQSLTSFFPVPDIFYSSDDFDRDAPCELEILPFEGIVDKPGIVHFQCSGKKMNFYTFIIFAHIVLLTIYGLCSICSIIWCLFFRYAIFHQSLLVSTCT